MTVAAVKAQAKTGPAPAKVADVPTAKSPPPAATSRRRGITPLAPMRKATAKSMRKLAAQVQQSHPDMITHEHLRDAAKQVEKGNEEGAQGHLRAAMFGLSPQSLMRHGIHADDGHIAARQALQGVLRHHHLVKDITAAAARNQEAIRRDSGDGDAPSPPRPDPNAGYGPGANAQKPTVRQPPGDQALNAPATSDGGGSDPAVADPDGPRPKGSRQFATWNEAGRALELVGTGGWQHGWKPGGPTAADHDKAAKLHTKAAAKAKDPAAKAMHVRRARVHAQVARKLRSLAPAAPAGLAYDWGDLLAAIELSAKTASLEATPAPRGKPAGPGLYGVSGQEHTPYLQQVVKGLIEKRGMDPGKAYAVARGSIRKWGRGGGKVRPEVRAAATAAEAGEMAKQARAKATHAHAASWSDVGRRIDLAAAPPPAPAAAPASGQAGGALPARVAAGSATGGQFSAGGGGQPSQGKAAATGKTTAKPPLTAHQQHVAHVAHLLKVSTAKAGLLVTAQDDRQKAAGLIKQRDALVKAMASAGGKASTGQAGAKTAKTATTKTTAPAAAKTATASTTAAKPAASAAAKKSTSAAKPSASATSAAGLKTQVAALNTQISALLAQASQATAQAQKMK
jgi:hypothetical protein